MSRHWRNLFHAGAQTLDDETFQKADTLLENLRPESPLRHRLGAELAELKKQHAAAKKPARQTAKK